MSAGTQRWKERGNDARDLLDLVEFREQRWCVLIISSLLYFWLSPVSRFGVEVEYFDAHYGLYGMWMKIEGKINK